MGSFPTPLRSTNPAVPGFGAAPSPVAPNPVFSQPLGTVPNYPITPGPVASRPILSQPSGTVPNYPISNPSTPVSGGSSGGYNPNTTYPGPYGNNADNYKVWLNNQNSGIPSAPTATDPNTTAGSSPWLSLAGGNGPTGAFGLNPQNFATPGYAANVAKAYGGTVVPGTQFAPGSPFYSNQPQQFINLPNGNTINPAVLAQLYSHGYGQSYVNNLVQNYMNGSDAYNSGVAGNAPGQGPWGYNTNAPLNAAQNWQAGTAPGATALAQNPGSVPNSFFSPGQAVTSNAAGYTTPSNFSAPAVGGSAQSSQNSGGQNPLMYLTSPQIQQLYGGNPFNLAGSQLGSGNLASLLGALSTNGGSNSLGSIAALLNLFAATQNQSSNGNLNPLFFNNSAQASPQLYYPLFY